MNFGPITLPRLVVGAALAVLAVQLGLAFAQSGRLAVAALRFPFPLAYSEGPLLDQAVRMARLANIYSPSFDLPPYTLATTPPLYPLVLAPLTRLLGPGYQYGRLMALLSAVFAAACIGLILHTVTHDLWAAVSGGVMLLAFPQLLQAAVHAQGDTLALALSLAGLFVIVRASDRRALAPASLGWGALLLVAASYTRQSYALAAPLAAVAWLAASGQRRSAATLAAVVLGSVLALGLVLSLATAGGFWRHLALATFGRVEWGTVVAHWAGLYLNAGYLLIAGLVFAIVDPLSERSRAWPLFLAYLAGAALVTVAAGQLGGSGSDVLSLAAALCLGVGGLLAWAGERFWLRTAVWLVLALQVNQLAVWAADDQIPLVTQKLTQARETAELAAFVQQAAGPVLADEFNGLLPLYGRRIEFQPLEYRHLAAAGRWDSAPLIAAIEDRSFAAILLYQPRRGPGLADRWAPELRQAIYQYYETHQTLADTLIYVPRAGSGP